MSLRLKQNSQQACRALLAADLASVYMNFISAFPDLNMATVENFAPLFEKSHLEYLFYSGNCTLDCPYHEWVVEEVLQLSAAYLYFPAAVVHPHARRFGLLLVFYFYFTQPAISSKSGLSPIAVPVASHIINDILDEKCPLSPNSEARLVGALSGRGAAHSNVEKLIVLAMHKHQAWSLMLYGNNRVHLQALIQAHENAGALLLSQQHKASSPTVQVPTLPSRLASRHPSLRHQASTNLVELNSSKRNTSLELPQMNSPLFSLSAHPTPNEANSVFTSALLEDIERYEAMKQNMGLDSIF
ncbi:unnamed protein product [Phytomonas sp. EM1]|nr:unnamed protein product [Phytomonas sp. EM1]|eukprot:CCW60112.1 unnamed protein product [Phytomonas sp. isolate EM1]